MREEEKSRNTEDKTEEGYQSARKEHADDAEGIIITTETGGETLPLTELTSERRRRMGFLNRQRKRIVVGKNRKIYNIGHSLREDDS